MCLSDSKASFRGPLGKATTTENLAGSSVLESPALYYNVSFFLILVRISQRFSSPSHTKRRDGVESGPLIVLRLCSVERDFEG